MRLDGFIGPGHVSTVIGCRPYEWIAQTRTSPSWFPASSRSIFCNPSSCCCASCEHGEAKVENQYKRVVPWEGNRAALCAPWPKFFELRPYFEWRGLGFISQSALRIRDDLRRMGRRAALRRSRHPRHRSEGRAVRRSAERRAEAGAVQTVRQGVHAGTSGRRADGFFGRLMRSLLQLRTPEGGRGDERQRLGLKRLTRDGHRRIPRSGFASRRSKWRTAPAARPAAA